MLVIPGNVGYLKQFFSAQLFVANGAPGRLRPRRARRHGTSSCRPAPTSSRNTADDPLALPEIVRDGETIDPAARRWPCAASGRTASPARRTTSTRSSPGEQGQAEFLIRGEKEGFHALDFDINAMLEGLPVGPVTVTGKASGGVLVRNPYFDMTFTVPVGARAASRSSSSPPSPTSARASRTT